MVQTILHYGNDATDATAADVGAADHDILTFTNSLEGSRIELINVQVVQLKNGMHM